MLNNISVYIMYLRYKMLKSRKIQKHGQSGDHNRSLLTRLNITLSLLELFIKHLLIHKKE